MSIDEKKWQKYKDKLQLIKRELLTQQAIRFYALLTHFVYWTLVGKERKGKSAWEKGMTGWEILFRKIQRKAAKMAIYRATVFFWQP